MPVAPVKPTGQGQYAAQFQVKPADTIIILRSNSGQEIAPGSCGRGSVTYSLPPGEYLYTARCDGFVSESGTLELRSGYQKQIELAPSGLTVHTQPGAGVEVTLDGRSVGNGKADDKGQFSLSGLKAGTYVVEAVMAGRKSRREETAFSGDSVTTLDFRLDPLISSVKLYRLNFTVTPADAVVQVFDDKGNIIAGSTKIGALRSYELPVGFYLYKISRPGYSEVEGKCQFTDDYDIPAVTLNPYRLTVTANPGTKLELLRNSVPVATQTVGSDGEAVFTGIPAGKYLLHGELAGCVPQSVEITVEAAADTKSKLTMSEELWDFQIFGPEGCRVTVTSGKGKVHTALLGTAPEKLRLPAGDYQADFEMTGRVGKKIPFRLPDDSRITARLDRNRFALTIHVEPVKVQADLIREDGSSTPVSVHVSGMHTFSELAPGNYQLHLTAPGYEDYREAFTIAGDDEDRRITMKRIRLSGNDVGDLIIRSVKTGDPVFDQYIEQNGAQVRLKEGTAPWQAVRFPYTFKNLKAGKHVVLFRIPAKKIKGQESEEITVEAGRSVEYNMFLVTF